MTGDNTCPCQCGAVATQEWAEKDNGYRRIAWFWCRNCGSSWAHLLFVNGRLVAGGDDARNLFGSFHRTAPHLLREPAA